MANLDLASIRERLAASQGRQYWRSLEELAGTPEFQELLHREFPQGASEWLDPVSRRTFLQLMGASLALAGVGGACTRQPREPIVPYVKQPEQIVPGKPLFFATAASLGGYATGVLVESHEGRPTKIEGNPDHPASLGATDAFTQAAILGLYDPDRSQVLTHLGRIRPWSTFLDSMRLALGAQQDKKGAGLRILTETVTSPALALQLRALLAQYPKAKWHQWEPAGRDAARSGARLAFGEVVETRLVVDKADVILALDADFLASGPGSLRYARDFARRRGVGERRSDMNRLYAVESSPSITGAKADHRLALRAAEIEGFARAVAAKLGVAVEAPKEIANRHERWIEAVARDLKAHGGASLVVAGEQQSPAVHALAHAINHALGNTGRTVVHTDPVEASAVDQLESLRELVDDIEAGSVEVLVIVGGNPVFTAPADLELAKRFEKVALRVRLGLYDDETSELCHWHVPEAHFLESWSDARAYDGTVTIVQPLIAPLYDGKSAHEIVAVLAGETTKSGHDVVRDHWKSRHPGADFDSWWRRALHDGIVPGTALAPKHVSLRADWKLDAPADAPRGVEIIFRPDPTVHDGRFANNGWLQELPKPLTKLTWDNAAMVSRAMAERLGLTSGDVVALTHSERSVEAPVWIQPGHSEDSVTVHLGYGRRRVGRVGNGAGFDAYALRTSAAPWFAEGLEIRKVAGTWRLAVTQEHHSMEGRNLVRSATLAYYQKHPDFAQHAEHEPGPDLSLFRPHEYPEYAWGMAIDLNACIGCGGCVAACQAENNIAVVGKDQVARGREMHWLRIDRYYEGDPDDPAVHHQPVLCMHCENAPCEVVCPVGATVHSDEGLNDMIYNRCVGTRYCSNNCPYKVRRFNFFLYSDFDTPSLKLARNPDVTVRSRGVMEKCTYCVQRINAARIEARKEDRKIRDGEIVTACQQACPTEAIVFGDVNDPESRVAKLKADPRNYGLLAELNTRPRTTYLASLRNPNPELEPAASGGHEPGHPRGEG